jgi:hypothetical protein
MKIINLPTFAEFASSQSGCGLRYTNNFKGNSGLYKLKIDEIYYKYCETLDLYSNAYLRNGMYSNIEDTTVEINRRYTNDMKKIQRIKK